MQLSTILDMLEGAAYGLDLLKLHSVTTKLLGRVDRLEEVRGGGRLHCSSPGLESGHPQVASQSSGGTDLPEVGGSPAVVGRPESREADRDAATRSHTAPHAPGRPESQSPFPQLTHRC